MEITILESHRGFLLSISATRDLTLSIVQNVFANLTNTTHTNHDRENIVVDYRMSNTVIHQRKSCGAAFECVVAWKERGVPYHPGESSDFLYNRLAESKYSGSLSRIPSWSTKDHFGKHDSETRQLSLSSLAQ